MHVQQHETVIRTPWPGSRSATALPAPTDHVTSAYPHGFYIIDRMFSESKSSVFGKGFKRYCTNRKPYLCKSLSIQSFCVQSGCMLFNSPASISWFQATALNFCQGTEPPSSLSDHVFQRWEGPLCLGNLMDTCHTWCNQSQWATNTLKESTAGKRSVQTDAL